jgi:N-acetylmuramoyl-L-alanine amidase
MRLLLALLLLALLVLPAAAAQDGVTGLLPLADIPPQPAGGPLVMLDPGHGTRDVNGKITGQGASGRYKGREVPEERLTLDYGMHILAALRRRGIRCESTRTYKKPWFDVKYKGHDQEENNRLRAQFATDRGAAVFVRIHFDGSTDKTKRGFSVWYNDQSKYDNDGSIARNSKRLAEDLRAALARALTIPNLGIKRFERPIYGFVHAQQDSVLLELAHLSNTEDTAYLLKPATLEVASEATAEGIADYLGR